MYTCVDMFAHGCVYRPLYTHVNAGRVVCWYSACVDVKMCEYIVVDFCIPLCEGVT